MLMHLHLYALSVGMTDTPSPATTAVWTRLIRASAAVQQIVETALDKRGLPPLSSYDTLWEIEKAGSDGIRPFVLRTRLLLPQYDLSRKIERLLKAGYVERQAFDGDGRGQILRLTDEGRRVRAEMWPVYAAALKEAVDSRMTETEALTLARLLGQLIQDEPGRTPF